MQPFSDAERGESFPGESVMSEMRVRENRWGGGWVGHAIFPRAVKKFLVDHA